MAIIEFGKRNSYEEKVIRKHNNAKKIRVSSSKALQRKQSKAVRRVPEVMVKISGFTRGGEHTRSNLDYISRNGDLEIEDDRGNIIKGRKEIKEFSKEWTAELHDQPWRKNQRDTMRMVLSMPVGTPAKGLKDAARNFASRTFGNHEYIMALHTSENDKKTKQPHVHLTVKVVGNDGKRLNPRKRDLQTYREAFAKALEEQGIAANATPRALRGIVRKPLRQTVGHIEARGISKVHALKMQEVANEIKRELGGEEVTGRPWNQKIHDRQKIEKNRWLEFAERIETNVSTELKNVRPRYERIGSAGRGASRIQPEYGSVDRRRIEGAWRWNSRVHQSSDIGIAGRRPASDFPGVRNLSSRDVVQDESKAKVFLSTNAHDSVANRDGRAAYSYLRRARDGAYQAPRDAGRSLNAIEVDNVSRTAVTDYMGRMPSIELERDIMRRELIKKFGNEKVARRESAGAEEEKNRKPVDHVRRDRAKDKGHER